MSCEYSGRPPDTNSQQPSLRPEQRTARSELATREVRDNPEIPFGSIAKRTRENDYGRILISRAFPLPGQPPAGATPEIVCF